jgi:hypothetical protein
MPDGTIDDITARQIDRAHTEPNLVRVLNDTTNLVQRLRRQDLSTEEEAALRRLLRVLIELQASSPP